MNETVSRMRPGEEASVLDLWERCGLTRPWNDPSADLARALASPAGDVLVARVGDTVIGTVMVGVDGHRAWVYYLGVDPDARRRGTGRALMQAAEEWAADRDAPKILLMVRSSNTAVQGFYDSLGYAEQDIVTLGRRLDGLEDGGARRPADGMEGGRRAVTGGKCSSGIDEGSYRRSGQACRSCCPRRRPRAPSRWP